MPELPDLTIYQERLLAVCGGQPLVSFRALSPFVVRTVSPAPQEFEGRPFTRVDRVGKRLVFDFGDELLVVVHLMIAGRFHWRGGGRKGRGGSPLAEWVFPTGTLVLTEAGTKRRAAIHLVRGRTELQQFARGGVEPLETPLHQFAAALRREVHTVKRALTDPRIVSAVGNAYSDEILHAAQLSPTARTDALTDEQIARLHRAVRAVLTHFIDTLRRDVGTGFPEVVTAFHPVMAVHGRYQQPCPACGAPVQRIRYADRETNYCARCQTDGRILADRGLSRLLGKDFPRTLEELEG
jgi:formamidopyrimidine-DNA glycosylase